MNSLNVADLNLGWQLAADTNIILTKNRIIEELYKKFGRLSISFKRSVSEIGVDQYWPNAFAANAKISRGEQYAAMPWVMLDYPRHFHQDGHLAVRVCFWWGHHFSIRLMVSGHWIESLRLEDVANKVGGWSTGWTNDPWNLELPNAEWQPNRNGFSPTSHWVMAKKNPIEQWEVVEDIFAADFQEILSVINRR